MPTRRTSRRIVHLDLKLIQAGAMAASQLHNSTAYIWEKPEVVVVAMQYRTFLAKTLKKRKFRLLRAVDMIHTNKILILLIVSETF